MRKNEYREWLNGKMKPKSIVDRLSRCAFVEAGLGIDLDEEYAKDGGKRILGLLQYNINDFRAGKKIPDGFHFKEGSNIVLRMNDMRSATKQYFIFCGACPKKH